MPPTKENKIMHWIQTILLSVCTAGIIWVGSTLVELKVSMATAIAKQDSDHDIIAQVRLKIGWLEDDRNDHEIRIVKIEADLPEALKKKQE